MGTRFVACRDNTDWHPAYAQRILDAREGEDIVFPATYGPSRALPSGGLSELLDLVAEGHADEDELTRFKDIRLIAGQRDGDMKGGLLPAGQVSGAINDLIDAADFIPKMVEDAIRTMARVQQLVRP
jgi:NAD(P)H-dependent flavin oxidoreductase YrpB (nitropropane dioxygenase family)